ncbi:MAG: hypothetical protein HY811_12465 [Planctomycetes bacterium]|nr:hypothetical protein [Planctomycetota bacterium]
MIVIIRIHSQHEINHVWDELVRQKDEIQSQMGNKCHLLYLTKRLGYHNETSLLVDFEDQAGLKDLIVNHISKIKGVDGFALHHLYAPKFYPLPHDTQDLKRFTVILKAEPVSLSEVYKKLIDPNLPEGLRKVYFAFTFYHMDESLLFSLLAQSEDVFRKYVTEVIDKLPGVLKTSTYTIERTKPFISYEDWQAYASQKPSALSWSHLKGQFTE